LSYSRWGDGKSTATPIFLFNLLIFLFQLPNPLLQELALWFLLGQGQSFLIRGPGLGGAAQPAVHIGTREGKVTVHSMTRAGSKADRCCPKFDVVVFRRGLSDHQLDAT
jgi:hypothetical protein